MAQTDRVEKLLRRAAGSITAYMDTVGERPLRISDFDKAVLAVRDGELEAFKELLPRVSERADELLIEAAGRAGAAKHLLDQGMDYDQYRAWAEQHSRFDIDEQTANKVRQYWDDIRPQEQSEGVEQETPQLEGMTL